MHSDLYSLACRVIPGGVNSPVRAFKSVGIDPVFIKKADGKYLYDEEGHQLLDFCMSWGASILGHNNPIVRKAVLDAVEDGTSFGFCHRYEAELAELIIESMPSIEMIRFVNSGTEAVISAVRLARAFTGRNLIVKFDGCYHGHGDPFLVKAGSGVGEISQASSKGIPEGTISDTISIPYNDAEGVKKLFAERGAEIACVIVEPVAGNMGLVPPVPGYLKELRRITLQYGSLLIFDEVISGFRVAPGGAQQAEDITPDLTTLGKIIGGGLPVGAFGGRSEIMERLAPLGDVYQAGTLSGNPLAMRAGIAVLKELHRDPSVYDAMESLASRFVKSSVGIRGLRSTQYRTIFGLFHTEHDVHSFADAASQDMALFRERYKRILQSGILIPPSAYETLFLSQCHDESDIDRLAAALKE